MIALLDEITTAEDLASLTAGSIVSDRFGRAWEKARTGPGWSDEQLLSRAPLTVLYMPEWRAQAKAEALRKAAVEFDREAAADRAADRLAGVRCSRCGLRYGERQEYSCQIEGTAHQYDEVELAEASQPDSETCWIGDSLRGRAAAIEAAAKGGE